MQNIKRFKTIGAEYEFGLKNLKDSNNISDTITSSFNHAMKKIKKNMKPTDFVGANVFHPSLDTPVLVSFKRADKLMGSDLVDEISRILQSNQEFTLEDEKAVIRIVSVQLPEGSGKHGRRSRYYTQFDFLNRKGGSIIKIRSHDNLCLARALVTAKAFIHKQDPLYKWESMRKGDMARHTAQRLQAKILMKQAGLANHKGPCGIPELEKLQAVMNDYQIKIFDKDNDCRASYIGN